MNDEDEYYDYDFDRKFRKLCQTVGLEGSPEDYVREIHDMQKRGFISEYVADLFFQYVKDKKFAIDESFFEKQKDDL